MKMLENAAKAAIMMYFKTLLFMSILPYSSYQWVQQNGEFSIVNKYRSIVRSSTV
jgi:hypothetical protein